MVLVLRGEGSGFILTECWSSKHCVLAASCKLGIHHAFNSGHGISHSLDSCTADKLLHALPKASAHIFSFMAQAVPINIYHYGTICQNAPHHIPIIKAHIFSTLNP